MKKLKNNALISLSLAGIFLLAFLLLTILVKTVDVQAIGPNGSKIGLAALNGAVFNAIGENALFYNITEFLGLLPFAVAGAFAILGICQAIKRKSIKKVDLEIYILGAFYVAVIAAYILFEIVEINYRPILVDGALEASYPSTHTMLAVCIMTTAIIELHRLIKNKKALLIAADCLCVAIAAAIVIGRLLSGVHWTTDIIAGLLLSGALVSLYCFAIALAKEKIAKKANKETDND